MFDITIMNTAETILEGGMDRKQTRESQMCGNDRKTWLEDETVRLCHRIVDVQVTTDLVFYATSGRW